MIEIIGKPKFGSKLAIVQMLKACLQKFELNDNNIIEVMFVGKDEIQKLNETYRKTNKPTDVLSFPQSNAQNSNDKILGSIVICEEIAQELGEDNLALVQHGFLHLQGFDHENDIKKWNEAELKIK